MTTSIRNQGGRLQVEMDLGAVNVSRERARGRGGGFGLNVSGGEVPRIAGIFYQDRLPQATTKLGKHRQLLSHWSG